MQDSIAQSIIMLATNDPETDHEQLEALKAFARECNPEMTDKEIEAEICKMR